MAGQVPGAPPASPAPLYPGAVDHFCCPRCLAVSWSPADVAAGYCGSCRDVTWIEGLTVRMHWRAGEWKCKPCSRSYMAPYGHTWPPTMCEACGRVMTKRLHAQVTVDPAAYTPESRAAAEMYLGSRVTDRDHLAQLRGTYPVCLGSGPGGRLTGRTWAYVGTVEGEMVWAQADLSQLDARLQSCGELASGVIESMQHLAGLTMEAGAALYEQCTGRRREEDLPSADDSSIESVLARNQIVIDAARALIENHPAANSDSDDDLPWTDPASWSPGDAEL